MLQDRIQTDLKQAQIDRNEAKVSTLRMLISEINYAKIKKGSELEDSEITQVIQREIKKRLEAEEAFRKGDRAELAEKETHEAEILKDYLPSQLSDQELSEIVTETISKTGATQVTDMGKVIGIVMGQVQGKADGGRVSTMVKAKLTQ